MSSPAANPKIKTAARQRNLYALGALLLIVIGSFLLAGYLQLLPAGWMSYWPVLLILLGLFIVLTGRITFGLPLPAFAIPRGAYPAAHLWLDASVADVRLDDFAGSTQLAVGQFPDYAGPQVKIKNGQAHLILDHRASMPFLVGGWSLSLVKALPWSLTLRSQSGHFHLNLRNLNVTHLRLDSLAGDVELTLPTNGQADMQLSLTFGDLILRVPEEMGVKIKLNAGPLVNTHLDNQRFIQTAPGEWVTPNFSQSPHQAILSITLSQGNLWVT
jgi:hypothetical protein